MMRHILPIYVQYYYKNLNKSNENENTIYNSQINNNKIESQYNNDNNDIIYHNITYKPPEKKQMNEEMEQHFIDEEGRIIFRNGLLNGIIHKYSEIFKIVDKIQNILLKGVIFNLVYKASNVGDQALTFHQKCDNLNMSLVLIETTKNIRFGGFTTKSWSGNNVKKKDNNAFVFNLETNSIFDIKFNEPAIGCYPKFGPVFFGCQIRIYDNFFSKGGTTCHKSLNYYTTKDYELNNGEQFFYVKDIEVYDILVINI